MDSSCPNCRYVSAIVLLLSVGCSPPENDKSDKGPPPPQQLGATPTQAPPKEPPAIDTPGSTPDYSLAGLEKSQVKRFLERLRVALHTDDREAVASLIDFPVRARVGTGANSDAFRQIQTKGEFLQYYDRIFTECLIRVIDEADVDTLFVNWQGARIRRGAVWINSIVDLGVRITSINGIGYREPLCSDLS
jgi:hypothetical protein